MAILYDNIGHNYSSRRQSDPRIGFAIQEALADCRSVLNVGAGTGSYEPRTHAIVAVEPSRTMIEQRPQGAACVIQARAEALPFQNASFDAVLIPADCRDGFLGAYWKRPNAYLDPAVREKISTFSKIGDVSSQLQKLRADIESGAWEQRYSRLLHLSSLDLGYRLLIARNVHAFAALISVK